MKCPKCKRELKEVDITSGFSFIINRETEERLVCNNPRCEYFGIPRLKIRAKK